MIDKLRSSLPSSKLNNIPSAAVLAIAASTGLGACQLLTAVDRDLIPEQTSEAGAGGADTGAGGHGGEANKNIIILPEAPPKGFDDIGLSPGVSAAIPRTSASYGENTVVVGGAFSGVTEFGNDQVTAEGPSNAYLAIYDINGKPEYRSGSIQTLGGPGDDAITALEATVDGGLIIGGTFSDIINVGGQPLTATDATDGFVVKLNSTGEVEWVTQLAGNGKQEPTKLIAGQNGDVFVTVLFDQQLIAGTTYEEAVGPNANVGVLKLVEGDAQHLKKMGGNSWQNIRDGVISGNQLYLAGAFAGEASFAGQLLKSTTKIVDGGGGAGGGESNVELATYDGFMVALNPDTLDVERVYYKGGEGEEYVKYIELLITADGLGNAIALLGNQKNAESYDLYVEQVDPETFTTISHRTFSDPGTDKFSWFFAGVGSSVVIGGQFTRSEGNNGSATMNFGGEEVALASGSNGDVFMVKLGKDYNVVDQIVGTDEKFAYPTTGTTFKNASNGIGCFMGGTFIGNEFTMGGQVIQNHGDVGALDVFMMTTSN